MIRLSALQAFYRLIESWCYRLAFPVVVSAWSYSLAEKETWHWLAPPAAFCVAMFQYRNEHQLAPGVKSTMARDTAQAEEAPSVKKTAATSQPRRRFSTSGSRSSSACSINLAELPTEVLGTICSFLHPRNVTTLCCLDKAARRQFACNQIWKRLWYRDYGNALLTWKVGREVVAQSLGLHKKDKNNQLLRDSLSQHLNLKTSLKDFYFVFGEIYTDYLLARRNSSETNNCYLGLHGHLLDFSSFAPYHPGLAMDEILLECGQDATLYFEQLPHSRGARALASVLVEVVNKGVLNPSQCGFALRTPPEDLPRLLRLSNSRPVTLKDAKGVEALLPKKTCHETQRASTLKRIRREWDARLDIQREKLQVQFWQSSPTTARVYYDPLKEEWITWDAAESLDSGGDGTVRRWDFYAR